jgi:hypothetical protein
MCGLLLCKVKGTHEKMTGIIEHINMQQMTFLTRKNSFTSHKRSGKKINEEGRK